MYVASTQGLLPSFFFTFTSRRSCRLQLCNCDFGCLYIQFRVFLARDCEWWLLAPFVFCFLFFTKKLTHLVQPDSAARAAVCCKVHASRWLQTVDPASAMYVCRLVMHFTRHDHHASSLSLRVNEHNSRLPTRSLGAHGQQQRAATPTAPRARNFARAAER